MLAPVASWRSFPGQEALSVSRPKQGGLFLASPHQSSLEQGRKPQATAQLVTTPLPVFLPSKDTGSGGAVLVRCRGLKLASAW